MSQTSESNELKSLKKQRTSIKGQLTRIESFLSRASGDIHELQVRKDKTIELGRSFDEIQSAMELIDEATDHEIERDLIETQYFHILSSINRQLSSLQSVSQPSILARATDSPNNTLLVKQANTILPKIEIKSYDGNPIEWHSFYDTFKSLVHDNEDLPAVQKFYFLKNALRGEVATITASLNASETNYMVAWDLLQKRCNKPRQIVQAHLKTLFELSDIARDSPVSLRSLAEHAEMHVNALKTLGQPTDQWDSILVYLISSKLDKITRRAWERKLENEEMPKFEQLIVFIQQQARGEEFNREDSNTARIKPSDRFMRNKNYTQRGQTYVATSKRSNCTICKEPHDIYQCQKFLKLSARERLDLVKSNKMCLNCLRTNHFINQCHSSGCRKCSLKNNTLLHFDNETIGDKQINTQVKRIESTSDKTNNTSNNSTALTVTFESEVLLGTAQVKILDRSNKEHNCRILLDGGSQTHFITEDLANRLNLKKQKIDITFSGLNQQTTCAQYLVKTRIKAHHSSYSKEVSFITLPSITGHLPSRQVDRSNIAIPRDVVLADPDFHKPGKIDALLGNTLFFKLLSTGRIKLNNDAIILQKTRLGWIVTGNSNLEQGFPSNTCIRSFHITASLDKQLARFWELEEIPARQFLSGEEKRCEEIFRNSTIRQVDGRYTVRLPFNDKKSLLGNSKQLALKRFYSLERRLHANKDLLEQYQGFLTEYKTLGHLNEISSDSPDGGFYLPHHAVTKESSETTKVRVVFDASAKTTTGISLNDTLVNGPILQDTLFNIILRFRCHSYVLTGDIEKMFRQIRMHPDDRIYQKILWRDNQDQPIKVYQLNTVTYGTTSAPFLAVRCLQQLANDEQAKFPLAAHIFKRDFYMDDVLTGSSTRDSALRLRNELIALGKLGGFHLRQWTSNEKGLIEDLNTNNHERTLLLDKEEPQKTLGVGWIPNKDLIVYNIKHLEIESVFTKRSVLSHIARLFDPLGLLGPVITRAKIIMQLLWKARIDWDEPLPESILNQWTKLYSDLSSLRNFEAPRKVIIDNAVNIQIHGFSDASEAAYGACIYLRSVDKKGSCKIQLLCAKSRIAPVKNISIPRLELCAAKLLANLFKETINALSDIVNINKVYL